MSEIQSVSLTNSELLNQEFNKAIKEGDLEKIKFLVENGAIPDANHLAIAASKGNLQVIEYFIGLGIKPNAYCLIQATIFGYCNVVECLVGTGIIKNYTGAFFTAMEYGHFDIIKYFISLNAHVSLNKDKILSAVKNRPEIHAYLERVF